MSFTICTDSTANLPAEIIDKFNISVLSLDYVDQDGKVYKSYEKGVQPNLKDFYDNLRQKKLYSTACINQATFEEFFTPILASGQDVIYIGFSSGLSSTYQSSLAAVDQLRQSFPDRVIYTIDSLCASMGLGLLVYSACLMREQGKSIHDVRYAVDKDKHRLCHLFSVDDLFYLYKGGRLSPTSYLIANLINVKPLLRCDKEGKLCAYGKVIGRKKSLISLVNQLVESIVRPEEQTIFISHGDCLEDAQFVEKKIREKLNVKDIVIGYIDSVIGSHSGPGTIAIFYYATNREIK